MALNRRWSAKHESLFWRGWLRWLNLRPEESERTLLMFAFYTATSMGLVWLEASTVALFLDEYDVDQWLPWIYVASACISSSLGFLYSRLQKIFPLRWVVVVVALLIALPTLGFRVGLNWNSVALFGGLTAFSITVLLMRLWLEAVYVLSDLNTSITANQLFNIREIKRAYPLISSGILMADVISGFSLQLLLTWVRDLSNVILLAFVLMSLGGGILFYLCQTYQQAFPDSPRRRLQEHQPDFTSRRLQGPLRRYVMLLFSFFIMAQVLFLLVDFQFLSHLQEQPSAQGTQLSAQAIAGFLGIFNGLLGIFELLMQWLASSRVIERIGVFASAMLLPAAIAILGTLSMTISILGNSTTQLLFISLMGLKFLDELLHYTLFASVGPVLFQPIPDTMRGGLQAVVRGIAEPLSTGATGLFILGIVWFTQHLNVGSQSRNVILLMIVLLSLVWLLTIWFLRAQYVGLLVISAERGQLSVSDVDLRELKRAVIEALDQPVGTEADKRSCIELLSHIDPKNIGEVLAPLLTKLPPALQRQSLEEMMAYPNPIYLPQVRSLMERSPAPEVLAVALRYIWLTESDPDIHQLRPYLKPDVDPVVRGTAASLMLRRGNPRQKAEATETLRRMLTHERERERVMGCRALGEAVYMQSLRLHIAKLLQDESLRVRCALLEAIAATHLEEYYPSLLRGLYYKSTREAAMQALVRLENDAIPLLVQLAEDVHKPEIVRTCAWTTIGQIGTIEALDVLVSHLTTAWGSTRRSILRILLQLPREAGIDVVSDTLGRSGIETLINQEITFVSQIYASLMDLTPEEVSGSEADLLRRALYDMQADAVQRLFLLMRFLYPASMIRAASFNLQSDSRENVARGLEILDNTLDIPGKRALLSMLDRRSDQDKLESLAEFITYTPMVPSQRLRHLLELRHFLSDWALACCFHLARQQRWSLTTEQILACLHHPTGFVREAVLTYLKVASPRTLKDVLPLLHDDPDRLVAAHVRQLMLDLGLRSPLPPTPKTVGSNGAARFSGQPGLNSA